MRKYFVPTELHEGVPKKIYFPYGPKANKVRGIDSKTFFFPGGKEAIPLFGMDQFDPGGKNIVVTEGELDAMSIYHVTQGKYPAVSVKGASSAKKDCTLAFPFLNSFDRVILAFDADGPGEAATEAVKSLFDPKKVLVVKFNKHKDANAYIVAGDHNDLYESITTAKLATPENIIYTFADIRKTLSDKKGTKLLAYPFKGMEEALKGLHTSEFILFKGMEGIGKTELFRAIEYKALKETDVKIAMLHLEETTAESMRGLVSYELQVPANMEDTGLSDEDALTAYSTIVGGDEERCFFQNSMQTDDPEAILNNIRFLVSGLGCKMVFLDHLSYLVTGLNGDDERKTLDYLATRLKQMVNELDFCLVSVMHVNDDGRTRSSRYPPKMANTVVSLNRDIEADDFNERNQTHVVVNKGRAQGSSTGYAGYFTYDFGGTYTLKDPEDALRASPAAKADTPGRVVPKSPVVRLTPQEESALG
jgi:twinkle protein